MINVNICIYRKTPSKCIFEFLKKFSSRPDQSTFSGSPCIPVYTNTSWTKIEFQTNKYSIVFLLNGIILIKALHKITKISEQIIIIFI